MGQFYTFRYKQQQQQQQQKTVLRHKPTNFKRQSITPRIFVFTSLYMGVKAKVEFTLNKELFPDE